MAGSRFNRKCLPAPHYIIAAAVPFSQSESLSPSDPLTRVSGSRYPNIGSGQSQMEHLLRLQVAQQHRSSQIPPPYAYSRTIPYQPVMSTQSYLRSSAVHSLPHPIPHAQSFSRDSPVSSYSSSGFQTGSPTGDAGFAYSMEGDFDSGIVPHPGFYAGGEQNHDHIWSFQERPAHNDFYGGNNAFQPQEQAHVAEDTSSIINRYLKQEEPQVISLNDQPPTYFGAETADSSMPSYAPLQANGSASMTADMAYGFDQSVQPQGYGGGSPSFTLASDPNLQYPPPSESIPRFVSPAQIAPAATLLTMEGNETTGLDPRYTVGSPAIISGSISGSPSSQESASSQLLFPRSSPDYDGAPNRPKVGRPPKRRRTVSFTSTSSSEDYQDGDSERDTDDGMDDDDDEDYVQGGVTRTRTRRRTISSASSSSRPDIPLRRMAPPVPVPNLTKKSRGRRVPTTSSVLIEDQAEKVSLVHFRPQPTCLTGESLNHRHAGRIHAM